MRAIQAHHAVRVSQKEATMVVRCGNAAEVEVVPLRQLRLHQQAVFGWSCLRQPPSRDSSRRDEFHLMN
jgi:hypothetical protein